MRDSNPPAFASRLLQRFGPSESNEALSGDLAEHYRHGRSTWWYRREVAAALTIGLLRNAWRHKWLVPLAMAVGYLVVTNVEPRMMRLAFVGSYPPLSYSVGKFLAGCVTGFFLALLYRPRHIPAIVLFGGSYLAAMDLYPLLTRAALPMQTWLLYTGMDLVFLAGLLWSGTLRVHRSARSLPEWVSR